MSRGAVMQITSKFNSSDACQVASLCHKAEAISQCGLEMLGASCSAKVYFQAGGKYWKNADWYLGKHLTSMGVKVAIELHWLVQAVYINSILDLGKGHKGSPWAG